jgi:hypothetical protein
MLTLTLILTLALTYYLSQFIKEMAKLYTLAVWTSATSYNGKPIVNDLFIANDIPLLFAWYNDKCTVLSRPAFDSTYPSYALLENGESRKRGLDSDDLQDKRPKLQSQVRVRVRVRVRI